MPQTYFFTALTNLSRHANSECMELTAMHCLLQHENLLC